MDKVRRIAIGSWMLLAIVVWSSSAMSDEQSKRPAWTTSRIVGSPEPPPPYVTERAFPALQFKDIVDLVAAPPGAFKTERLFVVEQWGKIHSFPNRAEVAAADLAIDVAAAIPGAEQTYSLAFHPRFNENRLCYICYIRAANQPDGTRIASFRISESDPPTIDPASEQTIITWLSGGHNGCTLKFGPDGYLYISTGDGDGPNPPDTRRTGQDVSDLLSSILRIDVDRPAGEINYSIPSDNPFVDLPRARGEVWAYGLRNPWRMSFDAKTGDLWVGDVGWELFELLHRVERGGNYGWAVTEGNQPTNPEWPRGPTPILPPTIEHSHVESSSITDGLTYYGSRLPKLHGKHIYGDYDTGKFWAFRYADGRVTEHEEIADTTHRVVGFGEDPSGEFYVLDHTAGTIHRLIENPREDNSRDFPRLLSESGLFASQPDLQPAAGVLSYEIAAEPWSDHATAVRHIAIPGSGAIQLEGAAFKFPENAVLAKTLSLELVAGDPATARRIETQLLHFDGAEWQTYAYAWNDEQTDAQLVALVGAERTFEVADTSAPDGKRRQTWRFASRAECQRCHNKWSGPVLAFHPSQLGKQLAKFSSAGLLAETAPSPALSPLVNPHDESAALDARARSYLHVNCAHCHRMHAGGAVLAFMHHDLPLEQTNIVGVRPSQGAFGIAGAQIVAPGDPCRSVLWLRVSKLGGGRMPHIGSSEVDVAGAKLLYDWIAQLSPASEGDPPGAPAATAAATELAGSPQIESMLQTTGGALRLLRAIDSGELPSSAKTQVIEAASRHADVSVRDLFERFLPAERRARRLGAMVRPEQILSLSGDAARGEELYFRTSSLACKNCHRLRYRGAEEGKNVGPELTAIGKRLSREQILESILEPSKRIDPKFETWLAETDDGRLLSGLLLDRGDKEVTLQNAEGQTIRLSLEKIEQLAPQRTSLMPELQFRDLTAQQLADLVAFLASQD